MKRCVAENDPSIFKILEERGMYCLLVTSTSLSAKLKLTNIPLMTNSSEIFKKNYCISYEEASRDSLSFRSGSLRLLDELDEIVKWFDGIQKAFKCYGDDLSSKLVLLINWCVCDSVTKSFLYVEYSEAVSLIAKRFTSKQFPGFLDSTVTSTLSEVMISLSSLQLKSLDNMQEKMNIFATFSAHTRDVKDAKRFVHRFSHDTYLPLNLFSLNDLELWTRPWRSMKRLLKNYPTYPTNMFPRIIHAFQI